LNAVESADASRFPQGLCCKSSLCVSMTRHRPRSSSRAITPAFLAYCFRCTVRTWMHIFPIIIIYSQTYNCVSWPDHDAVCATLRSRTRLLFASFSNLDLFIALSTLCAVTTLTGLILRSSFVESRERPACKGIHGNRLHSRAIRLEHKNTRAASTT
jgi:hypothetical protein